MSEKTTKTPEFEDDEVSNDCASLKPQVEKRCLQLEPPRDQMCQRLL